MAQLRVDVVAARARAEFASASRSVNGFRDQVVNAEQAANRFERELQNTQTRLGGLTAGLHQAEQASEDAAVEVRRLRQQVDALGGSAPEALVRQLHQAERAAEETRQEEERLRRVVAETTAEASRLSYQFDATSDEAAQLRTRLTEAVIAARALRVEMVRADRATNGVGRSTQRGLLGFRQQIDQLLGGAGGNGGPFAAIRNAVSSAWQAMPVELRAIIIGVGATMAAFLATAIGAALNGLLLAAIGGAVGIGVAAIAAKTSNVVQKAFRDVFRPIKDDAVDFAAVAEGPLVSAARSFGQAWADVRDDVRGVFADAAPGIADLADGLGGFVREVMPGLRSGVQAAAPLLRELARDLPVLGEDVGRFFEAISRGGDGAQKGLRGLLQFLGGAIVFTGELIGLLSRGFDAFTNRVESILTSLSHIPIIGRIFEGVAQDWQNFNNLGDGSTRSLNATGEAADRTALGMGRVADATQRAAAAAQHASDVFDQELNKALGLSNAHIQAEAAIDAVTESFKQNGRSLDANTEKGRNNLLAINSVVQGLEEQRKKEIESGVAIDVANAHYAAQIERLRGLLTSLGLTKAQVDGLIGSLKALPTGDKQLTYRVKYIEEGGPNYAPKPGLFVARASGGPVNAGQLYRVGEQGPEMFVPSTNGVIVPNNLVQQLESQMARTRNGGAQTAVLDRPTAAAPTNYYSVTVSAPTGSTPADVGKAVVESIKAYERTSGKGWRTN